LPDVAWAEAETGPTPVRAGHGARTSNKLKVKREVKTM